MKLISKKENTIMENKKLNKTKKKVGAVVLSIALFSGGIVTHAAVQSLFFEDAQKTQDAIENMFQKGNTYKEKAQQLQMQLDQKQAECDQLNNQIVQLQGQLQQKDVDIQAKNVEMQDLQNQLSAKQDELAQLQD